MTQAAPERAVVFTEIEKKSIFLIGLNPNKHKRGKKWN